MSELVLIVAIVAAGLGASFNTIEGYLERKGDATKAKKYSVKKLTSALITSIFTAFATINLLQIPDNFATIGYVGIVMTYLIQGYGIDKGLSKLDS